jgi:hypothetical protein
MFLLRDVCHLRTQRGASLPRRSVAEQYFKLLDKSTKASHSFRFTACQKILQQRIAPLPSPTSTPRPTTPNHYSLGRYSSSIGPSAASHGGYAAGPGFSSSSLSSVVAGSTLGPAGAAIGTGHSSLAGYNGSAHNLHSSVANLNTNGALAARGKKRTRHI